MNIERAGVWGGTGCRVALCAGVVCGTVLCVAGWGCKPASKPAGSAAPPRLTSTVDPLRADLTKEGPTDADAPEEFTRTSSGLEYRVLRRSKGDKPNEYSSVTISERMWVEGGTEVENTYLTGVTNTFAMDKAIRGTREGITLIGEGGKIEIKFPPNLGFGTKGFGVKIPPGATLHSIIELHAFK